jgi:hypothetical protein
MELNLLKSKNGLTKIDNMTIEELNAKYGKPQGEAPAGISATPNPLSEFQKAVALKRGEQKPSLVSRIGTDIKTAGEKTQQAITGEGEFAGQTPIRRGVEATAEAFGAVPKIAGEVMKSTPIIGEPIAKVGEKIGETVGGAVNWLADKLGSTQLAQDFVTKHPDAAKNLEEIAGTISAGGEIAGTILSAGAVKPTVRAVKARVEKTIPVVKEGVQGTKDLYTAITTKSPEAVDAYITGKFEKGVRPSVVGKSTAPQIQKYKDKTLQAVKTITQNKNNLNLVDEFGESTNKLPQTLKQFADSIDQTKKVIFSKYDALQKTAGEKGATVKLDPAITELRTIESSPTVQDLHPELANYAKTRADALEKRGSYTTQSAQDAITNLNISLEAFYKNPSYETASKAGVDALIANKLRAGLDSMIEKTTGAGYQDLKNQYGALKTIEKDVVHRSIVDARKSVKGLIDFSDILSGGQVVTGLLSFNPTLVATGVAQKGIASYLKMLNDPNIAIKKLFNVSEKYQEIPK